jgi:hypothetical protein
MSEVEIDLEVIERAARLVESVTDDHVVGTDVSGFGSDRVQAAADGVQDALDAGARSLAEAMTQAAARIRGAEAQWRAQDARLARARTGAWEPR